MVYEEDSHLVVLMREPHGGEHGLLLVLSEPIHLNLRLTDEEEPTVPTLPVLLHSVLLPAVCTISAALLLPLLSPGMDTEPVDGVKDPDQLVGCVVGGGDGRVRADSDGAVKDR